MKYWGPEGGEVEVVEGDVSFVSGFQGRGRTVYAAQWSCLGIVKNKGWWVPSSMSERVMSLSSSSQRGEKRSLSIREIDAMDVSVEL